MMNPTSISEKRLAIYPYVLLFLGAVAILCFSSPLAPFANKSIHTDAGVYIYCAEQILDGKIMYKEIFDHKGPLLYLINIIGLLIGRGNPSGIWYLQVVLLFVALSFIYKSLRLYFSRKVALLATLSYLLLYLPVLRGGDIPEDHAILFMSVSMYYFLRFFKTRDIKKYHFAIIAFCCTCVLLLKPNMIALWIAGYLFVFFLLLKNKRLKELIPVVLVSVVTLLVVCLPFVLYFFYTDSWADFKFCYWDFNKAYSRTAFSGMALMTFMRLWLIPFRTNPVHVFLFIFFIGLILNFKYVKCKVETVFFVFLIVLTSVMLSVGGTIYYTHYYLLFIPILVFPYAEVFHFITNKFSAESKLFYCFFVLFFIYSGINEAKRATVQQEDNHELVYQKCEQLETIRSFIQENSEETDKITVVGNGCWIYTLSGRNSVSKYAYQYPLIEINRYAPQIVETYMNDIKNEKPRIIVIKISDYYFRFLPDEFCEILETQYEKVAPEDVLDWGIYFWLRKPENANVEEGLLNIQLENEE